MRLPKVSFVVCTLNCKDYAERCFESIRRQNYPQENVEIVVVDSYSTDGTIEVAKKYKATLILTKVRGYMEGKGMPKSIGCARAKGEIVFTLDSDNFLVEKNWIRNMIYPLLNDKSVDYCICRMKRFKDDSLTNQYLSLVGTDPFAIYNSLDPQISMKSVNLKDKGKYWTYHNTKSNFLITGGYYLGFRKSFLNRIGGYTRDVDVAYSLAAREQGAIIAISKEAHLHHLITKGLGDFARKKMKWGRYYFTSGKKVERDFNWTDRSEKKARFAYETIKNLLFFPELIRSIWLSIRDKESIWLMHSPIVWITTCAYILSYVQAKFISNHM